MTLQEKLPEWVLPTYKDTDCWNDYATVKVLGKGSYGTTHLAKDKKTGEEVAVKVGGAEAGGRMAWRLGWVPELKAEEGGEERGAGCS